MAAIATHYNVDFAEHYIAPYLAERGIGFLGWNTRYRGAEDLFHLEHALIDIGAGVNWLRAQGIEKIVLLGNSGGGSLMAAYQAEATAPFLRPPKAGSAKRCQRLPKADLYISLNAHPGRPEVLTNWMDASVSDETDPLKTDASLDPFDPGPAVHGRLHRALSRGASCAQPSHHGDGRRRSLRGSTRRACRTAFFRCSAPGPICVSWIRRSNRRERALPRLLRGRSACGQPLALRHRPRQHAARLAVDVEP